MRLAWSTALLPLGLSLACSNEAPPLTTDTNTSGFEESGQTFPDESSQGATTDPESTGNDDSVTSPTGTDPTTNSSTTTLQTSTDPTTSGVDDTFGESSTSGTATTLDTTDSDSDTSGTTEQPVPACVDGMQNNEETDVDCGGPECPPCATDQACNLETDCDSNVCTDNACVAPSCSDGVQNQDETDIDCGGDACGACVDGDSCVDQNDCISGVCTDEVCQPPACDDAVQNQDESDVDCGGLVCDPCGDGDECLIADDCASAVCLNNVCESATCFDDVKNQDESDVDCGGAICAPCMLPGLILNEVDYDNVGTDSAEFVEIYNNTGLPVSLVGIHLVLVNGGNNTPYLDLALDPGVILNQGQYLVVANAAFVVPPEVVHVNFAKANDNLQNDLEGIALIDTVNNKLLDALSYEGSVTMANLPGLGVTSLVEGAALAGSDSNATARSVARFPNGNDKNDAATDWILSATPTPGVANLK